MNDLRAVFFDATGTLIELRESPGHTYARFAGAVGISLPAWRIDDAFGRIFRSAPPMVFPDASQHEVTRKERAWWHGVVRGTFLAADSTLRFKDFEGFFDDLYAYYASAAAWRLRRGADRALAGLRERDLILGVISNFDHRLPQILKELEINEVFGSITLPSTCAAEKPHPHIFQAALSALGVGAEQAVYVGHDPVKDLAAAESAGLRSFDVTRLADLGELPTLLGALGPAR